MYIYVDIYTLYIKSIYIEARGLFLLGSFRTKWYDWTPPLSWRLKWGLQLGSSCWIILLTINIKWDTFQKHYSSECIHMWDTEWIQWETKRIWRLLTEMLIYMHIFCQVRFAKYNILFNPFFLVMQNILETSYYIKEQRKSYGGDITRSVVVGVSGVGENEITFSENWNPSGYRWWSWYCAI